MKSIFFALMVSTTFAFQNNLTVQTGQTQIAGLQSELNNLTAANTNLTNAYQQAIGQLNALRTENQRLQGLQVTLNSLQANNTTLQSEINSLKAENQTLKDQVKQFQFQFEDSQQDIDDLANLLGISYKYTDGKDLVDRISREALDALKTVKNEGGLIAILKKLLNKNDTNGGNIYSVTYNAGGRGYTVQQQGNQGQGNQGQGNQGQGNQGQGNQGQGNQGQGNKGFGLTIIGANGQVIQDGQTFQSQGNQGFGNQGNQAVFGQRNGSGVNQNGQAEFGPGKIGNGVYRDDQTGFDRSNNGSGVFVNGQNVNQGGQTVLIDSRTGEVIQGGRTNQDGFTYTGSGVTVVEGRNGEPQIVQVGTKN